MEDALSSTVQVDGFEVTSSDASAEEMVKNLTPPSKDGKLPEVKRDRGVVFEKSAAAVELGKKGGEASAKARQEAKEAAEAAPEPKEAREAKPEPEKAQEGEAEPEKPVTPKARQHDPDARVRQIQSEKNALLRQMDEMRQSFEDRLRRVESGARPPEPTKESGAAPAADGKPNPDQFATYEEYVEALADFRAEQKLKGFRETQERERIEGERRSQAQKRHESFRSKVADRAEEWGRVDHRLIAMMRDAPPVLELGPADEVGPGNLISEAITQSEDPTGFALYLTENEDVVRDLIQSSPWQLPMKLGRIEARFVREGGEEREAAPARHQAPAPPFRPIQPSAQSADEESQSFEAQAGKRLKGVRRGLRG